MVTIPDEIDPSKVTTSIVLNKDGTFSYVPTTIIKIGNKYFAKINSLSNSTYSVIYNQIQFMDIQDHWTKDTINEMSSRLIVNGHGNGNFNPDKDITRAEVATVILKIQYTLYVLRNFIIEEENFLTFL